jgi:hypothetical protein
VHRVILRNFAVTGSAHNTSALAAAAPSGHQLAALLAELHDHDVVRLTDHGQIRAAYRFSATATAPLVAIDGGPTVYAMGAVDDPASPTCSAETSPSPAPTRPAVNRSG